MTDTTTAIETKGVSYTYERPAVEALSNVSFSVPGGTFTVVIGPNGSGKTTLLRLLLGLAEPTAGDVRIMGFSPAQQAEEVRRHIGYVPQHGTINPAVPMRNRDIVELGISARETGRLSSRELRERVDRALEMVDLADLASRNYSAMSGGQRQRVLIARALAVQPRVLILDEPFSAMDLASQDRTARLIRSLVDSENMTVLFVAHNLNPLVHFIDNVILLNRSLLAFGPPDDVLKPDLLREAYGASVPIFICEEGYPHPLVDTAHA